MIVDIVSIDVGGSLAKVVFGETDPSGDVILNFAKFDSLDIDAWLPFVDSKAKKFV